MDARRAPRAKSASPTPLAIVAVLGDVRAELERALFLHAPMHSAHEGYAVILEELDELWEEVRKGGSKSRSVSKMRKEALQIAAMAIRFVVDVCDEPDVAGRGVRANRKLQRKAATRP